ncbi:NAD(P)/FAD-dependent oxidoreductase [Microbacterium atlanticum]|uniref:NAD(P)/FAD-dependent oxidoreductase n=1 Tax=Microbacterium atlanticum TaxID=2782168 RepID=UPI001888226C|nr:NAD(P)/FAD-dependent oxidoreductase [Microbacterium atlanticum]
MYDVIVIGGGPAGLQAALTIGRMHRTVLLLDSGEYRNGTVEHAHNLLTNDGRSPAELRRIARDELAAYDTVKVRGASVTAVSGALGDFSVTAAGGVERARRLVLATGMRDELPAVPGLAEQWGRRVAQCPFCHGHEFARQRVAILIEGEHSLMIERMLRPVVASALIAAPADVARVEEAGEGLALTLAGGGVEHVAGIFTAATARQRAPFAAQLGCALLPSGGVEVDPLGRTTVPGVYAGGDMAHLAAVPGPMVSLAAAIASGQLAGASAVRDEIMA